MQTMLSVWRDQVSRHYDGAGDFRDRSRGTVSTVNDAYGLR